MSEITSAQKVGAIGVVLGMLIVLIGHPAPPNPSGHVVSGSAPAGSVGVWTTGLASPEALRLWGIDGGPSYFRARVCALPADGGVLRSEEHTSELQSH